MDKFNRDIVNSVINACYNVKNSANSTITI